MVRKIGLLLLLIALVFAGLSAYIVLNANELIARYKPQLEARVSQAIGGRVTFNAVSLHVFPRTELRMSGFDLREDTGDNLTLEELIFKAEFFPLLSGRLNVHEISLVRPQVTLIETEEGMRVAGLPTQKEEQRGRARVEREAREAREREPEEGEPASAPPMDVNLESFTIREGTITVRNKEGAVQHVLERLQADASMIVSGNDISLPSVALAGQIRDRGPVSINARDVDFNSLSGQLNVPDARVQGLGANLNLRTAFNVNQQTGEFFIDPGSYRFGPENIAIMISAAVQQKDVELKRADLDAFNGRISLNARARLENVINFATELSIDEIRLEQVIRALESPPEVIVSGPFSSKVSLSGKFEDPETLKKTLSGRGEFTLGRGEITGLNLGERILGSITNLPFIGGALIEEVPAEFREALSQERTVVRGASSNFSVANGAVQLSSLKLETDLLDLDAQGSYIIDGAMDLRASAAFSQVLSAALASRVRELQYALEDNGQLVIPVRLQGTPERLVVTPDTSRLMRTAGGRAIEEGARRLLDRAIGGKKNEEGEGKESKGGNLRDLGRQLGF